MKRTQFLVACALIVCGSAAAAPAPASQATVFVTDKAGQKLAAQPPAAFRAQAQPEEHAYSVIVDPAHKFQTIEGIGGALTDASAETYAKLSEARKREVIQAYYDPEKGIGYSLGRTHIHSCDFSSSSYTYVKDNDAALTSFSVAHDRQYRLPFIHDVLKANPRLKMFVSPWSPPAWMKSNNDMLHGGTLKPEFRDSWARYYVKFIQAYRAEGVPIWGLTVQNEPMAAQTWESCIFTGEQERDFVRDHLGPTLEKAGMGDLKLMVWDHNRGLAFQRGADVLSDPAAAKYVWGTAYHWYLGDEFSNLGLLHDAFPDKAVFFSEGCNGPFSWKNFSDWSYGESYGRSMINDFNHWAAGWTDWNVLLDNEGGPNHVQNFCFAPLHADDKGELHYQSSYYYIGHFSKFVKPGARRIACTVAKDELEATAFENPDGSRVAVMMNRTDKPLPAQVWSQGRVVSTPLPAHSIASVIW